MAVVIMMGAKVTLHEELESQHMEEVGWMDGSNKHRRLLFMFIYFKLHNTFLLVGVPDSDMLILTHYLFLNWPRGSGAYTKANCDRLTMLTT